MTVEAQPYDNGGPLFSERILAVLQRTELVLTADETRAWHLWAQQRRDEDGT